MVPLPVSSALACTCTIGSYSYHARSSVLTLIGIVRTSFGLIDEGEGVTQVMRQRVFRRLGGWANLPLTAHKAAIHGATFGRNSFR